jgi:hypothetical protein
MHEDYITIIRAQTLPVLSTDGWIDGWLVGRGGLRQEMTAGRGQHVNCRRLGESDARSKPVERQGKARRGSTGGGDGWICGGSSREDDGVWMWMRRPHATKVCRFPMAALSVHYYAGG